MIERVIWETGMPMLTLKVIGKGGNEVSLEGILDTGFDGFLCLPIPVAVSLGLELIDATDTELAVRPYSAALVRDQRDRVTCEWLFRLYSCSGFNTGKGDMP